MYIYFKKYVEKSCVTFINTASIPIRSRQSPYQPEDTTFGVRISGDSMEPEFHDGQIAWVLQQESVANGEIGIFALNGEAYIKKLQNDKDGIFLISLNEKYAPIKVGENDRLDIFGKVLGKSDASAITGHCR